MRYRQHLIVTIILLVIALIASACSTPAKAEIAAVLIKASDYTFTAPSEVQAGLVSITFENGGQEVHHLQLVALKAGVTTEQVMAALAENAEAMFPLLQGIPGGVGPLDPGGSGQVTVRLEAGNYLLLCFIPDKAGVPHIAHGMIAPLTVKGAMPANQPEPASSGTVRLVNFSFALPETIKSGQQIWKIVNAGDQPHEIALLKLADGKTMADVMAYNQKPEGAPPFANIGGFQGINPGASGWLHLDLTPGTYIAVCHIPDPASGKAHSELGMMLPFVVQ